jgi:hypothetical protein
MLSILLLVAFSSSAQKNRPLAGDCISLIEILQTDYALIDDDNIRTDRIIEDRRRVVSIVKNYLSLDYARPDEVEIAILNLQPIKPESKVAERQNQITSKQALAQQYADKSKEIDGFELQLFNDEMDALLAATSENTFLQVILKKFKSKYENINKMKPDVHAAGYLGLTIQKSGPLISGGALTFTEAIDGLSKFIVKRIKEELAGHVFSKISELYFRKQHLT